MLWNRNISLHDYGFSSALIVNYVIYFTVTQIIEDNRSLLFN